MDNRDELVRPYHKADKEIEKGFKILGEANRSFDIIQDGENKQLKIEQQISKVNQDSPVQTTIVVTTGIIIGIVLAIIFAIMTYTKIL